MYTYIYIYLDLCNNYCHDGVAFLILESRAADSRVDTLHVLIHVYICVVRFVRMHDIEFSIYINI